MKQEKLGRRQNDAYYEEEQNQYNKRNTRSGKRLIKQMCSQKQKHRERKTPDSVETTRQEHHCPYQIQETETKCDFKKGRD